MGTSRVNKRHESILNALQSLNGIASIRQIAEFTGFHVNGISQSLGCEALKNNVTYLDGNGGDARYRLESPPSESS